MQVSVPVIVKDPVVTGFNDINPTEKITVEADVFLDGPVSPRVAVLDFEPNSGALAAPARFAAPKTAAERGSYDVPHPVSMDHPDVDPVATAVSVFGAVHKTVGMFEEMDALGRPVYWAFDAPQLLVVPRAGEMANAYYERESHSLQFFFFFAETLRRPVDGSAPRIPRTSSHTRQHTPCLTGSLRICTRRSRRSRSQSTRRSQISPRCSSLSVAES
jgi:hypothetical protein